MKKRNAWIFFGAAAVLLVLIVFLVKISGENHPPVSAANADNFGTLLADLVKAYETPSDRDERTIEADLEAIRSVDPKDLAVAQAITEHWRTVYLDPDYRLHLFRGEEKAGEEASAGLPNRNTHAIVVLGYELRDGEMQPELKGRCDAAAALSRVCPETILVCSGGATGENNPEGHTEAGLMKAYLADSCGIDPSRIFTDEKAMTTAENAVNTFEILRKKGVHTMTIVTSGYHQRWGQALYNLLAELYRQQHGYRVEIVGNYCYDIEPSAAIFAYDDRIAVRQIAGILELPQDALRALPSLRPPTEEQSAGPAWTTDAPVDYADRENWAYYALGEEKEFDLFLICPTVDMRDEFNMSMEDEETKASFFGALNMERGIYEDTARMFAPYYRQAAMKVYSLSPDEREPYLALAYEDVSAAFSAYLERENADRPILLAGFSQGADMCYRLLEEYFGDPDLADRLVAVYAIGWPCSRRMTEEYPQIRPAESAEDIGVVISFDCESPEVDETFVVPAGTEAYTINPLNWRTDGTAAGKKENPGACFTDYSGEITREEPELCGCYIDPVRGVLKITDIDSAEYPAFVPGLPEGAYHVYDYQFFFRALQQNVRLRAERYLAAAERLDAAA